MLEKIKAFGEAAKNVVLYILAPLAFVGGYILYLLKAKNQLEDELKAKESEGKLKELDGEKTQIDADTNDAVSAYEKLRGAYVSGDSSGLRQSGTGTEEVDRDTGPGSKPGGSTS